MTHRFPRPSKGDCAEECIVMFIRAPQKGKVKTRLSRDVGPETALDLYKTFTEDMLQTITMAGVAASVHYHPHESRSAVADWLGPSFDYQAQRGEDLGQRMENAFCKSFEAGYRRVLLVGSDLPDLPVSVFHDAFAHLKTHDAVIGPATDGGYYLIGFSSETFFPEIFLQVSWGSRRVLAQTHGRFSQSGLSVYLLPKWCDIDDLNDLKAFQEKHAMPPFLTKTAGYVNCKEF